MKRVGFHTLGCKVNQYETEAMEKLFEIDGYKIVKDDDIADVYVINTCTVTNMSDRKSRQFIRRAKKINPESIIAVVGCYSQVSPDKVSEIEGVDVVIGTTERNKIVDLCKKAKREKKKINIVRDIRQYYEFEDISIENVKSKTRAYIKIQDGCNQYCSYCIIPYARGPIRSRIVEDILNETRRLSDIGFKEIILTGIHVASYGKDLIDMNLGILIDKISKIDGIERIRLSSVEQSLITKDFLEKLLKSGKVCDHFHLSLQSGSNTVLNRMNRKYTREEFKEKVELIREYMPNAGITTDIIVGFPGETEKEFEETVEFVKDIHFSKIHVFKYSKREGTPAARMKDQIDGNIKNERSKILIELGEKLTKSFNKKFIGKSLEVLYEENIEEDIYEGYTSNYIRVKTKSKKNLINKDIDTNISNIQDIYLIGKIGR